MIDAAAGISESAALLDIRKSILIILEPLKRMIIKDSVGIDKGKIERRLSIVGDQIVQKSCESLELHIFREFKIFQNLEAPLGGGKWRKDALYNIRRRARLSSIGIGID
uniref:Uncharacterized protein n=1 Tax=Romanomermis culicivorax TaxID=13658 RepID=A0A915IY11_ROMCU